MPEPATQANGPATGIPHDATVLGFDVGARRIGVAVGSAFGDARPVAVIDVHDDRIDEAALQRVLREWRPQACIVGDPMTLDGGDQPIRRRARDFAVELARRSGLPVAMVDERSTSIEAAQRFARDRAEGRARRKHAAGLDAVAAAVIVDRWRAAPGDARRVDAAAETAP